MVTLVLVWHRALAKEYGGQLNLDQIVEVLRGTGVGEGGELAELLWTEMGLSEDAHITQVFSPAIMHPTTIAVRVYSMSMLSPLCLVLSLSTTTLGSIWHDVLSSF